MGAFIVAHRILSKWNIKNIPIYLTPNNGHMESDCTRPSISPAPLQPLRFFPYPAGSCVPCVPHPIRGSEDRTKCVGETAMNSEHGRKKKDQNLPPIRCF